MYYYGAGQRDAAACAAARPVPAVTAVLAGGANISLAVSVSAAAGDAGHCVAAAVVGAAEARAFRLVVSAPLSAAQFLLTLVSVATENCVPVKACPASQTLYVESDASVLVDLPPPVLRA